MTERDIKLEIDRFFDCPIEELYSAWIEPEQLKQWHAPQNVEVGDVQVDLRVGGTYRIEMLHDDDKNNCIATGEYLEIENNRRLVYTWGWEGPDRYETLVTVEFIEKNGGTELLLKHQRFANNSARDKHEFGWNGCLESLRQYLKLNRGCH